MTIEALIDSNVLVAALIAEHQHHPPSIKLFTDGPAEHFAVSAHSYAEAYNTMTRRGLSAPYQFAADDALTGLESIRSVTNLIGLTPHQTFATIRSYAQNGGIGARLYDRLIGEVAIAYSIPTIVTWSVAHMRGLFPGVVVTSPEDFR